MNTFYFQEVQDPENLEHLFRLRYEVYRNSKLATFSPENPWGINMDAYDARARHYGLFDAGSSTPRPFGGIRVIEPGEAPVADAVWQIAEKYNPALRKQVEERPLKPFPLMDYVPGADSLVAKWMKDRPEEKFCEASRFVIHPDKSSLRLGRFLIASVTAATVFCHGFQNALLACSKLHTRMYTGYGFLQVHETNPYIVNAEKRQADLLLMRLAHLNQMQPLFEKYEHLLQMAQNFRTTGSIVLRPDRPQESLPCSEVDFPAKTSTPSHPFVSAA